MQLKTEDASDDEQCQDHHLVGVERPQKVSYKKSYQDEIVGEGHLALTLVYQPPCHHPRKENDDIGEKGAGNKEGDDKAYDEQDEEPNLCPIFKEEFSCHYCTFLPPTVAVMLSPAGPDQAYRS